MGSAFIAANGLWSQEQQESGARLLSRHWTGHSIAAGARQAATIT